MARAPALLALLAATALGPVSTGVRLAAQTSARIISGRVVAGDTGNPVRNARVGIDAGSTSAVALTDGDGQFTIGPISADARALSVSRTGFTTASAPASDGIEIRLSKAAVITGRVFDDSGAPLPLMNVVALRRERRSGHVACDRVESTETDELGDYRLFGLPPGEFVVAAAPGRRGTATSSIPISPENLVLNHFYGPAEVPERARPIELHAGDEIPGIDITVALPAFETLRPQNAPRPPSPAAGVIRGRLLRADGLPARRGQVWLTPGEGNFAPYPTISDDEGRYEFRNLRAGTYRLSANDFGFARTTYGAGGPSGRGLLTLKAEEVVDGIDMTFSPGTVIAGRVLDEFGDAMQHADVRLERIEVFKGRRRLAPVPGVVSRQTDDQGRFRLFGLPPGRYLVSAVVGDVTPGAQSADWPGYARTYYPGTPVPSEAQTLEIASGQQFLGIDFPLARGRIARIAGTARASDGAPLRGSVSITQSVRSGALATAIQTVRTDEDGHFEFARLPPGEYVLQAATSRATVSTEGEFAARFITVDGVDVTGLLVKLSAGSTIEGRLAFDGQDPPDDPDFHVSSVPADPDLASLVDNEPARADIHDDWTFEMSGITGLRRLELTQAPDGWTLKEVRVNGIDVGDTPLRFGTAEQSLRDVEIVLSNRVTQLDVSPRGVASRTDGVRIAVAFPTDRARWYPHSRFVAVAPAGPDKPPRLRGLPPGSYYVAVVAVGGGTDGPGPIDGEAFFESLVAGATRVTLTEGEHRSVGVDVIVR